MLKQKTVKDKVKISGVGLHTGKNVEINILPALPNTGIQFKIDTISVRAAPGHVPLAPALKIVPFEVPSPLSPVKKFLFMLNGCPNMKISSDFVDSTGFWNWVKFFAM